MRSGVAIRWASGVLQVLPKNLNQNKEKASETGPFYFAY